MSAANKIVEGYRAAAIILLNILVFFILINVVIAAGYKARSLLFVSLSDPVTKEYGSERLMKAYPGSSEKKVRKLLAETWSRPFVYEAYTVFKEAPFAGEYVNVSKYGFRHSSDQGPWPIDKSHYNIFIFGGSTTFGYGLPDDQTIPSGLQRALSQNGWAGRKVKVYNFGRGHYFSTQERILFESLLLAGHIPHMALFIDGMNDFYYYQDQPLYTDELKSVMDKDMKSHVRNVVNKKLIGELPLTRLINDLTADAIDKNVARDDGRGEIPDDKRPLDPEKSNATPLLDNVIARYMGNKKMIESIAAAYGVKAVFVWQPAPTYKYDVKYHYFSEGGFGRHDYSRHGYARMRAYAKNQDLGKTFIWAADMQEKKEMNLYLDKVHYTAEMSDLLAQYIASALSARDIH